jgi:DNA polymerase
VRLLPLYHPAAALYTRSLLATLREDFARIPELLAMPAPEQPVAVEPVPPVAVEAPAAPAAVEAVAAEEPEPPVPDSSQLGLF